MLLTRGWVPKSGPRGVGGEGWPRIWASKRVHVYSVVGENIDTVKVLDCMDAGWGRIVVFWHDSRICRGFEKVG